MNRRKQKPADLRQQYWIGYTMAWLDLSDAEWEGVPVSVQAKLIKAAQQRMEEQ